MSKSFELEFKPNLALKWYNNFNTCSNKYAASSPQNITRYLQVNDLVMVFYPIECSIDKFYYENEYINKIESHIDFADTKNIDILLKITKTIFDNYQICIYKKCKITEKTYKDVDFDIDDIYSPSSNGYNEIVSVIDVLNKLAYLADIKAVILLTRIFGNKGIEKENIIRNV